MSTSNRLPSEFNALYKWKHINIQQYNIIPDVSLVSASVAFQCINARGAIAHGRVIETTYVPLDDGGPGKGAEDIFNGYGGYLSFTTAEQIKKELMSRGPVVSVFFKLHSSFLKSDVSRCQTFNFNLQNELHDILIVGWEQTSTGECWIVYPLVAGYAEKDYYNIEVGIFGIDDLCIAPKNDFMEWNWQIGPYFRCNLDAANQMWIHIEGVMSFSINTNLMRLLSEVVGGDFIEAAISKRKFVIQDCRKFAHSRSCFLRKIGYDEEDNAWRIAIELIP